MVEINEEAVEAVVTRIGGQGDHDIVDTYVAVEESAVDQQRPMAPDGIPHGKEKLNGVSELVDGLSTAHHHPCADTVRNWYFSHSRSGRGAHILAVLWLVPPSRLLLLCAVPQGQQRLSVG